MKLHTTLLLATTILCTTTSTAQGLLKRLKNKLEQATQAPITGSSTSTEAASGSKWKEATDATELFTKNAIKKTESNNNPKAANYYAGIIVLEPNGKVYPYKYNKPYTKPEFKYTITGSTITYTIDDANDNPVTLTGKVYSNNGGIKIAYQDGGSTVDVVYTATPRAGITAIDMERGSKAAGVTIQEDNNLPYYIFEEFGYLSDGAFSIYCGADGDNLVWTKMYSGKIREMFTIPFSKISIPKTKLSIGGRHPYIDLGFDGEMIIDVPGNTNDYDKKIVSPMYIKYGEWKLEEASKALDLIVSYMPKDKQAAYAKAAPARKAEYAKLLKQEQADNESFRNYAKNADPSQSEILKTINNENVSSPSTSSNSSSKTKVKKEFTGRLENKSNNSIDFVIHSAGGGRRQNRTLNARTIASYEMELGGKITTKTGALIMMITADMEKKTIVLAEK